MKPTDPKPPARRLKIPRSKPETWELRLYVAGQTPRSIRAFGNLKLLCEEYLKDLYRIEVIDLMRQSQFARGNQIVAIPTLIRQRPQPIRKIMGDLSNTLRVSLGLDLRGAR